MITTQTYSNNHPLIILYLHAISLQFTWHLLRTFCFYTLRITLKMQKHLGCLYVSPCDWYPNWGQGPYSYLV